MIPVKLSGPGLRGWKYVEGDWPDEKRCTYVRPNGKRIGERCKCARRNDDPRGYCSWHVRWVKRCAKHPNGKEANDAARRRARIEASYKQAGGEAMAKFYGKYMTKALGEVLDECLAQNPNEQLQLYEELALIRDVAGQSVALYSAAKELADANPADGKKRELLLNAGEVMKMQISEVVRTCEAASRVAASARDKVSIHQLHFFVDQVTRVAFETFGSDPRAEEFRQRLLTQVKLPVDGGSGGTSVTPDMDANDMDRSVPKYEPVQTISIDSKECA